MVGSIGRMPSPRIDSVSGHRDFQRLWAGSVVSQFGSAVGMVALPVIAVVVLDVSAWQVSLLAGIAALTTALVAFPLGRRIEYTRKRPVMIGGDLLRAATLVSLPAAHALGTLTYTHLCLAAAVNAVCAIAFTAASQAHLKALVTPARLIDANSRLESTRWLSVSVGPALAGALIAALSAVGALVANTVGFLVGALAVRSIRDPEPAPPPRPAAGEGPSRRSELFAGLGFVWHHPTLRPILVSWVLFAGASSMAAPLTAVFYMRDLGFSPFEYGLLMGVPSLGGLLGARLVPGLVRRLGAAHPPVGLPAPRPLVLPHPVRGPRQGRAPHVRGGVRPGAGVRRRGQLGDVRVPAAGDPRRPDVAGGHALGLRHHGLAAAVHPARGSGRQPGGRAGGAPGRRAGDVPGRVPPAAQGPERPLAAPWPTR